MAAIHAVHDGHELRCVTYGCASYEAAPAASCIEREHAVRCIACHTWADNDPRPTGVRADRRLAAVQAIVRLGHDDQEALF